jgi:hypothetical protein
MARQTKLKIAAIAATLVATLGVAGVSSATSVDAGHGHSHVSSVRDGNWCC